MLNRCKTCILLDKDTEKKTMSPIGQKLFETQWPVATNPCVSVSMHCILNETLHFKADWWKSALDLILVLAVFAVSLPLMLFWGWKKALQHERRKSHFVNKRLVCLCLKSTQLIVKRRGLKKVPPDHHMATFYNFTKTKPKEVCELSVVDCKLMVIPAALCQLYLWLCCDNLQSHSRYYTFILTSYSLQVLENTIIHPMWEGWLSLLVHVCSAYC